jgi:hypothetical protein
VPRGTNLAIGHRHVNPHAHVPVRAVVAPIPDENRCMHRVIIIQELIQIYTPCDHVQLMPCIFFEALLLYIYW